MTDFDKRIREEAEKYATLKCDEPIHPYTDRLWSHAKEDHIAGSTFTISEVLRLLEESRAEDATCSNDSGDCTCCYCTDLALANEAREYYRQWLVSKIKGETT